MSRNNLLRVSSYRNSKHNSRTLECLNDVECADSLRDLPIAAASEKSVLDRSALLAMLGDCTREDTNMQCTARAWSHVMHSVHS